MFLQNGIILIFFMAQEYSTVCTYHIFFLRASVSGHLGCLPVLAIVNISAVNAGVHVSFQTVVYVMMEVKVAQSCPTLCDPMDYTVLGILQARILERVAFPFSRGSFQPRDRAQVSRAVGRFFIS